MEGETKERQSEGGGVEKQTKKANGQRYKDIESLICRYVNRKICRDIHIVIILCIRK